MKSPQVLCILLDGVDADLLDDWIAQGALPNLAAFRDGGAECRLSMPRGFGADSAWPSVYSGQNPAVHGRYYHRQETSGDTILGAGANKDTLCDPVWVRIGACGKRVVTLDLPKGQLTQGFNGVSVVDYRSHTSVKADYCSWPSELANQIVREFGPHVECPCYANRYTGMKPEDLGDWVSRLKKRLADQVRLGCYLMREEPSDVFMIGLSAGHCAGHQFWYAHDPDYPTHSDVAGYGRDPIKEIYQEIDRAIGAIIEAAGAPENVMVYAGPGMGSSYLRWDLLDELLIRLDLGSSSITKRVTGVLKSLWRRLPGPIKNRLAGLAHRTDRELNEHDRDGRRFFAARSNDAVGGVTINRRKPGSDSILDPGEFDTLCNFLVREITAVRNRDTGQPIAKDVFKTADVYASEGLANLPDILIEWDQDVRARRVHSDTIGTIEQSRLPEWSGTHRPRAAIFVKSHGQGIHLRQDGSILDVAPTLAALAGVSLSDVEGRPLFSTGHLVTASP